MLKVLYILDSLNRGGTETYILDLCRNSGSCSFELMLAATGSGTLEDEFADSGVQFFRFNRKRAIDLRVVYGLRRLIKREGVDIVHAHQAVEGIHAYLAAFGTRAKTVLSYHGGNPDTKNVRALRFISPKIDLNIFVSEALRKWYSGKIGVRNFKRFSVVHNGVDNKRLSVGTSSLRKELGIGRDAFLMGMTANFHPPYIKDQLSICKAMPKVLEKFPECHFVFAGGLAKGGEENLAACKDYCEKANISRNVHFLGERTDVPEILKALDLFVFSSFQEGMPIAVIEAMLAGLPILLSDIEPLREVAGEGNLDFFGPGDESDLANKMIALLGDADLRNSMAFRSHAFAIESYSIEANLNKLAKVYGDLR